MSVHPPLAELAGPPVSTSRPRFAQPNSSSPPYTWPSNVLVPARPPLMGQTSIVAWRCSRPSLPELTEPRMWSKSQDMPAQPPLHLHMLKPGLSIALNCLMRSWPVMTLVPKPPWPLLLLGDVGKGQQIWRERTRVRPPIPQIDASMYQKSLFCHHI